MLNRTKVRYYIHAMLASDQVPQGVLVDEEQPELIECDFSPLYVNCNGDPIRIEDSFTHQALADNAGNLGFADDEDAFLTFSVPTVIYTLEPGHINKSDITADISIYVRDSDSSERQNILDQIEERIYVRLLSYQSVTYDEETIQSFMRIYMPNEAFTIESNDESDTNSDVTIRTLNLKFSLDECIRGVSCDEPVPVCIEFKQVKEEQLGCH